MEITLRRVHTFRRLHFCYHISSARYVVHLFLSYIFSARVPFLSPFPFRRYPPSGFLSFVSSLFFSSSASVRVSNLHWRREGRPAGTEAASLQLPSPPQAQLFISCPAAVLLFIFLRQFFHAVTRSFALLPQLPRIYSSHASSCC